jgi:Arc/MetJ-type ribon-helix-helix transcriptional regulator
MNIALADDLQRLLREKVANGQFPSEEAAVKEALTRFLTEEAMRGNPHTSSRVEGRPGRDPGPFLEDETVLAPLELRGAGCEIACSYLRDVLRQPDRFPGE